MIPKELTMRFYLVLDMLTAVMVGIKLTGLSDRSWFMVTAPFWTVYSYRLIEIILKKRGPFPTP